MEGWIKLHRSIQDHWIWSNSNYLRAWIIMLFTVNYEDKKVLIHGSVVECKRGQSLLSLDHWVDKFGISKKSGSWTIQKVRTFFNLLQKDQMIHCESVSKTTRLTICNYNYYQDVQQDNNKVLTRLQQDNNMIVTTTKERKELKKEKKENKFIPPVMSDVTSYFEENGYKREAGIKAYNYYNTADWRDSKGNAVKNWKQKMIAVWFKDENKVNGSNQIQSITIQDSATYK